jgi:hypothetical protein
MLMWLFFNQIAYRHYHLLENGTVIEHSHPFKNNMQKNTPYQKHTHSDTEYLLLSQITTASFVLVIIMALLGLLGSNALLLFIFPINSFVKAPDLGSHRLRGPPILSR